MRPENVAKRKASSRAWYEAHRTDILENNKSNSYKTRQHERLRREAKELETPYIVKRLADAIPRHLITDELIALKREQLSLQRLALELKQAAKQVMENES